MIFVHILVALLVSLVSGSSISNLNSAIPCNNSPDLCSRSYSSITHLGAHDSAFVANHSTTNSAANQHYSSVDQLSAGIRLLSVQVHSFNGTWHLCHTSCILLDAGVFSDWLTGIKGWMDENPHDVVTLLIVNFDSASPSDLAGQFDASGITKYAYTPSSQTGPVRNWPTLQTLIDANTRLMTFVTNLPASTNTVAPYLMDEFQFIFENAFEVTDITNFTCTPARPDAVVGKSAAAIQAGYMPLMNHFLDKAQAFGIVTPDLGNITTTNSPNTNLTGALGTLADTCRNEYSRQPAFILVDFFDEGPSIVTADNLNGISNAVGRLKVADLASTKMVSGSPETAQKREKALLALIGLVAYMVVFL